MLLFSIIRSWASGDFKTDTMIVLSGLMFTSVLMSYLFNNARTVKFDDKNMYLTGSSEVEIIQLSKIHMVKMTSTKVGNLNVWKIGYENKLDERKAVRILPKWLNNNFEEFKDKVKLQNPKVTVRNWSHSFDFDQ